MKRQFFLNLYPLLTHRSQSKICKFRQKFPSKLNNSTRKIYFLSKLLNSPNSQKVSVFGGRNDLMPVT